MTPASHVGVIIRLFMKVQGKVWFQVFYIHEILILCCFLNNIIFKCPENAELQVNFYTFFWASILLHPHRTASVHSSWFT